MRCPKFEPPQSARQCILSEGHGGDHRFAVNLLGAEDFTTPAYTCFVPGCPGNHTSKRDICVTKDKSGQPHISMPVVGCGCIGCKSIRELHQTAADKVLEKDCPTCGHHYVGPAAQALHDRLTPLTSKPMTEWLRRAVSNGEDFRPTRFEAHRLLQEIDAPETSERLSSGDAIACISMALQNPPVMDEWGRLLRDCRAVIERLEDELTEAKRQRNDEQRLRLAAERGQLKTSSPQCVYRSGCKQPEVCQTAGHCVPEAL